MGRFWRRWILVCFCCCEGKNHEQIFWIIPKYVKKLARTIHSHLSLWASCLSSLT
jgi:hypothetical protein